MVKRSQCVGKCVCGYRRAHTHVGGGVVSARVMGMLHVHMLTHISTHINTEYKIYQYLLCFPKLTFCVQKVKCKNEIVSILCQDVHCC